MEKQIQNDTVEPADDPPPAAAGAPADATPTATTTKAGGGEKAVRAGPAGRGAIDDDASGGPAIALSRSGWNRNPLLRKTR